MPRARPPGTLTRTLNITIKKEDYDRAIQARDVLEKKLGITLSIPQFVQYLCNQYLKEHGNNDKA